MDASKAIKHQLLINPVTKLQKQYDETTHCVLEDDWLVRHLVLLFEVLN